MRAYVRNPWSRRVRPRINWHCGLCKLIVAILIMSTITVVVGSVLGPDHGLHPAPGLAVPLAILVFNQCS